MSGMSHDLTGMSGMSHDVAEMSEMSLDVREECYIIVVTGRCVNKPGQTKYVGCYGNTFISNYFIYSVLM